MISSQRQYLVNISGIEHPFMTKTGGNLTADSNKVYRGGKKIPDIVTGIAEVDNITVGRAYDPDTDRALIRRLRPLVNTFTATITATETNADLVSLGEATTYAECVLVGITEPEYASDSGEPANFELEFAVPSVS